MKANYVQTVDGTIQPVIADLVDLTTHGDVRRTFLLTRLNVPAQARGKGYGSAMLRRVLLDANREGVDLQVHPTPSGGLNMIDLLRWYRRYGFQGDAGKPMYRVAGAPIPPPRAVTERGDPCCAGCGDSGPQARLEPLLLGNPTEGSTIVGYCCLDCAERYRKIILARYPALIREWGRANAIDVVNRKSRTLGRQP